MNPCWKLDFHVKSFFFNLLSHFQVDTGTSVVATKLVLFNPFRGSTSSAFDQSGTVEHWEQSITTLEKVVPNTVLLPVPGVHVRTDIRNNVT